MGLTQVLQTLVMASSMSPNGHESPAQQGTGDDHHAPWLSSTNVSLGLQQQRGCCNLADEQGLGRLCDADPSRLVAALQQRKLTRFQGSRMHTRAVHARSSKLWQQAGVDVHHAPMVGSHQGSRH